MICHKKTSPTELFTFYGSKGEAIRSMNGYLFIHFADSADYCSLSSIQVGTHEANPTMVECTDCNSFELKK